MRVPGSGFRIEPRRRACSRSSSPTAKTTANASIPAVPDRVAIVWRPSRSKASMTPVSLACRDKESLCIIPVFLSLTPGSMMTRGFLGPTNEQVQRGNYIKTRIEGNAIPSIHQGSFAGTDALFQRNLELLASKAEELINVVDGVE